MNRSLNTTLRLQAWLGSLLMGAVLATSVSPSAALAQRRVIGADDEEEEEEVKQDEAAKRRREKKKKEEEERRKKAKEKAEREAAERERKAAAAEAAAEAAEKAAEEAEAKAEEAKRKAEEEKLEKERRRLEANKAGRLKAAKRERQYVRKDGKLTFRFKVAPGAVVAKKVVAVRFKVDRKLDVASARYGDLAPEKGLRLVAVITEPAARRGEPVVHRRLVHALEGAGQYGFHFTPTRDGAHEVMLEGESKDGAVSVGLTLHVGAWPPPDFDEEERNNASMLAETSRSLVGG